jgi:hypothetical protein
MSEYGLSSAQGRAHSSQQYGAQAAPNVEWYSSTSQQQQYSNYNYHEQSFASSSGAQYGTFDDEAPLLEGALCRVLRILLMDKILFLIYHLSGSGNFSLSTTTSPVFSFFAELGIDIPAILSRTKSILTFRLSGHDVDSLDLGGPLVYMACLAIAHLLVGQSSENKTHFLVKFHQENAVLILYLFIIELISISSYHSLTLTLSN